VVKVLLQFKHETLVKNLMHGSGPNPNIDFMQTPFFVQTKNEFWKRQSIEGREVARVAGISSFGAGGSNAHVVIEEYRPQCEEVCSPDNRPSLIVLSAKNKDQLRKVMERLHLAVQNGSLSHFTLQEIAYTLQVGREPLDERVAMVVESVDQLNEKLRMILSDGTQQNGVVFGHCNRGGNVQPVMMNGSRIGDVEKKPFSEGELFALSEAWTQGARIDWNRIYGEKKPKLVSLPTYPFARERYWLSLIKPKGQSIEQVQATRVAPATQTQKPVTSTPGVLSADKYNSLTRDVAENSGQTPATHFVGRPSLQLTPIDGQLTDDDKAKRSINVAFDKPKEVVLKNITEMGGAEDVDASAVTSRKDAIASPGRPEEIDSRRAPVAKDTVENLHSWLSNSLKEVLLIDDKAIDIDKKFVDMGLDSIVGVEWVQTINKQYGLSISATKLYDYPTIREMASFVESETSKNLCMSGPPLREDLTIDEILMRIAQNTLSVDQAERMLCQATADKSGMHLNDVNPTIPPDVRQQHVKSTREVSQTQIFHEGAGDSEGAGFEDIVRNLAKGLAQALCIAEKDIDTDKKFTDMGLDSIIGVEWIQSINRTYGCSISATKLYDYPTLLEFAEFLKGELIVSPREVVKENGSAIRRNGAELGDALPANCKQEKSGGQKAVLSFQEVVDELKVTLAEALYMEKEKVDSDKNFVDMGLDSIIGVEWMQTINKRFNISVSATKIYDYPNIRKLSEYLAAEIPLVAIAH
jgi:polyketide synthase PksN